MKLTTANATVNVISVGEATIGAASLNSNITVGNVVLSGNQLSIGNSVVNPVAISVPKLTLSGVPVLGPQLGAIVNTQIFTANGVWFNPYYTNHYVQGLTYTYYTQSTVTAANTESDLNAYFNTASANPVVTFGGTGIHRTTINWGSANQTGAGGVTGTKPSYLPTDQFSWVVEGYILAPETGTYTFGVDGDDACDVFVNNTRVAHFYGAHDFSGVWSGNTSYPTQTTGTISLVANTYYTFRARVQEGSGGDGLQVGWRKPSDGSISLIPANAFFTTDTTKINPDFTGDEQVFIMMWGGGGGGVSTFTLGGGGGAGVLGTYRLSDCSSVCSVTVGSGGVANTNGGTSTFVANGSSTISAYGGGGATTEIGGGGGWLSSGSVGQGGAPLGGNSTVTGSTFGGGGGGGPIPRSSIFGGGGGGLGGSGISIYGGGGGSNTIGVSSVFGGSGANSTVAAQVPGGGGAASANNTAGARGEVRVWVIGKTGTTLGSPTYAISPSSNTLYDGETLTFTTTTTNISNGTILYYTLEIVGIGSVNTQNFSSSTNGSVVINGNQGTINLTANTTVQDGTEYYMYLRKDSTSGEVVATSSNFVLATRIMEVTQTANPAALLVGGTTGTFSGVSIGASSSTRVIAVCVGWTGTNRALTSFSIDTGSGPVNMTLGAGNSQLANKYSAIYYASVPESATTATFVATFPGNLGNNVKIAVYRISGRTLSSVTGFTDTSTDMDTTDPLTVNITIPSRGAAIAVAVTSSDTNDKTWSGLTENIDEDMGSDRYTTAFSTTAGATTVTCTGTIDGEDGHMSCMVITPA